MWPLNLRYPNLVSRTLLLNLLQAVKLREGFIELYKAGPLTMEKLKGANIAWDDVFEELPIRIQNGNLAKALLAHIEPNTASQQHDFKELQLGSGPMLLKTLDFMNEFLDETVAEQQKVKNWTSIFNASFAIGTMKITLKRLGLCLGSSTVLHLL